MLVKRKQLGVYYTRKLHGRTNKNKLKKNYRSTRCRQYGGVNSYQNLQIERSYIKNEYSNKLLTLQNRIQKLEIIYEEASRKCAIPGQLHSKILTTGNERTLWTTVSSRNQHPEWLAKKKTAENEAMCTQKEWDDTIQIQSSTRQELDNLRGKFDILRREFIDWEKDIKQRIQVAFNTEKYRVGSTAFKLRARNLEEAAAQALAEEEAYIRATSAASGLRKPHGRWGK